MMKLFLILFLMPNLLLAELLLEITKGSENPYRIAIIPFQGSSSSVNTIAEVFNSDLERTGEFYILEEEMLLSIPKTTEEINTVINSLPDTQCHHRQSRSLQTNLHPEH